MRLVIVTNISCESVKKAVNFSKQSKNFKQTLSKGIILLHVNWLN